MSFDNDISLNPERLQELGFVDSPLALKNVELLRNELGSAAQSLLATVLSQAACTGDPDMAVNNFERLASCLDDKETFIALCTSRPDFLTALVTVFGGSRFLSMFLLSDPVRAVALLSDPDFLGRNGKPDLERRLAPMTGIDQDEKSFFKGLRLFRKQEMLRIGVRDLLNKADLRETVEDLSDLAEVCLQASYLWCEKSLADRHGRPLITQPDGATISAHFAVIAMGKLGGRELNFSSDVDLMYVYSADGETEGVVRDGYVSNKITNHQYFVKLAEKISAAIGQKTDDGFVFRVDLRLRPEGQQGPLAQSLGGYEIYYESWGQTWERSALIKARPVAGDPGLGREFLERITPFVYRKYLDYSAIAEIREMKQKINKDVEQKGRTHQDVKLGYGGIREIEFVIQALQLIYAGRDRRLREKNSLKALHMLSQKGLITYQEQESLAGAYTFLRAVEHRIQIADDLQTQTIPTGEHELRSLARRTGYLEHGRETESLLRDYADHTLTVRRIYDNLFSFTGEEQAPEKAGDYDLLLDIETPEHEVLELLSRSGFRDPGKAYRNLLLLREGAAFVHQTPRSRKLFKDIFPSLFREILSSPDPDLALNHLESFLASQVSWETLQSLLKLDPAAARILIAVFGNSEYFSRMLISRPVLLQNLLESRKSYGAGTCRVFARELSESLDRAFALTDKLDALRRFKHQEEIRVGMADLLSKMDLATVSRDLSKLAEVCLEAALDLAADEVARHYRFSGFTHGLAIIGLGKLGGRELSYGSDLDIVFVYSEEFIKHNLTGLSGFEYFSKAAEKTISYLSTMTREGFAFRIDTRLRPDGSKGPLVQSIDAFRLYYSSKAGTWERQAMVKARTVAGDRVVGREFCRTIQAAIYRNDDARSLSADVTAMRKRIEEELGKEHPGYYNIKQGAGGLVDIEFIVQYLQLLHGKEKPGIRLPGIGLGLRALEKKHLLTRKDFDALFTSWQFLRRLESRLRIVTDQASSELSKDTDRLQPLARRMGYEDRDKTAGQQLLHDYEQISRQVRATFERIVKAG